jgi:hypothetical protein
MKNKNLKITLLALLVVVLFSCGVRFQTANLQEDKPLVQLKEAEANVKSMPVLSINNGVIHDFEKRFSDWIVSHQDKISIYPKNGMMAIESKGAGPAYEEIALNFAATDFSKARVLKLTGKIDGLVIPNIRMDLVDDKGRSTNSKLHSCKFSPRIDFQDYIYRYNDAFKQNWPAQDIVDSTRITKIRININGGGNPYFGTIYLDNLKAEAF